ncbi:MAG: fumarate hydratase [Candidatus Cloacimonetes bacterium]|nr:fumarate hydratase [Candidatus Cloacimonadota bacterium]
MRFIDVKEITGIVKDLCIQACTVANDSLVKSFRESQKKEESEVGKAVFDQLLENIEIARNECTPICQDTGFTVVFMEIGQEVAFTGGLLKDAVNEGVSQGYKEGYLRKSIVKDPITNPVNTGDNTPAILHTDIVAGDKVKIIIMPKGGGSENMSRIKMMKPADGIAGVKNFVIETVKAAGGNPCPPIYIGVGVGGTFDYVAYLAKKALLRGIGKRNSDPKIARFEVDWLDEVNKLGIGPAGLGGRMTALDLFIEVFPRHIATFPVAVNIQCHANREKSFIL